MEKIIYKNSIHFKAIYQDYDWCYDNYIIKGLSQKEMSEIANCEVRVLRKWLVEKHRITLDYRKKNVKLNKIQSDLIIGGILGDGHIDKRETQSVYVLSHAENQKDYLFWQYEICKNLCNSSPFYTPAHTGNINGKDCSCQGAYRFTTRIVDDLVKFRNLSILEVIDYLNELSLSIWFLDDAYRAHSNWEICVAEYSSKEKDHIIKILKDKFNINSHLMKDVRYMCLDAKSSRLLDSIILKNIPNNLDIIKDKIIENKICKPEVKRLVDGKVGLRLFCTENKVSYNKAKDLFISGVISSEKLLNLLR